MPSKRTTDQSRPGFFYVLQPFPELSPNRIKFGWTSNLTRRLKTHRCAAPTARVLASWPCPAVYEHLLVQLVIRHQRSYTRVGQESYDVGDLISMHRRIELGITQLNDSGLDHVSMYEVFLASQQQVPRERRRARGYGFADPTANAAIENVDSPPFIESVRVPKRPSNRRSRKEMLDEYWAKNPLTPEQQGLLDIYAPVSMPRKGQKSPG